MTHLEIENLASDYLEGFLDPAGRAAVEAHLAECAPCRGLVEDVRRVLELCRSAEEAEPTPWLVSKILLATVGERKPTLLEQLAAYLRPVLQPRVAYSVAMTVFAFSIIVNAAGLNLRNLRFEDLNPRTWYFRANRAGHLMYARAEKFYYDLRLVYEIESRLRQMRGQPQDQEEAPPQPGAPAGGSTQGTPSGQTQLASTGGSGVEAPPLVRRAPSAVARPTALAGAGRSLTQ
jgi:hypothetical protein